MAHLNLSDANVEIERLRGVVDAMTDRERELEMMLDASRQVTQEWIARCQGLRVANRGLVRAVVERVNANLDRAEAIARDLGVLGTSQTEPPEPSPSPWSCFDGSGE
jgi:hypothetical protein